MENVEELKVGSFVTICSRSQPGVNKLGGYAKVTKCHYDEDGDGGELIAIDVKYIVETGGEKNVSLDFVEKKEEIDGNGKDKAATPINTRRSSRRSHPVRSVPDNPAIIKKGRVKSTSSNKDIIKDEKSCSVVNPELDLNRKESIRPHTSKTKPNRGKKDRKITTKASPKQLSKKAKIKNDNLATCYPGTASLSTSCIAETNMNKHKISETTSRKSELNPKEKKRKINSQKKESKARRKSRVVGLELNRTQTTLSNFMPSTKKSKIQSTDQNKVSISAAKHFQKEDISPDSESMILDEIILDGGSKTCSALLPPEMELNQHPEFSNASDDYSIYCKMPNQSRNKTKPKSHKKLNLGNTEATSHPSQSLQTQEARSIISVNRKDLSFSFFTSSSSRDSFMQQDKNKNKKISVHKSIEGDLKRESMSNQSFNKMNKKATKKSCVTNINKENNMKNVEGIAALKQERKSSANVSRVSGRLFQDVMSRSSVGRPDGIILVKDRSNGTTTDKFRSNADITKTVETNESRREDRQVTFRKVFLNCMLGLDNIHVDKLLETINERMISQTKFTKEEIETNLSKLQDMNRLMVSESVVYMI